MYKETFFKSVTCIDTETTDLIPDNAEIVEVAGARYNGQEWTVQSMLLGSLKPIPPEASAKNNISQRMIAGKPTFAQAKDQVKDILHWNDTTYWIAHNCQYDQVVLSRAWVSADEIRQSIPTQDRNRWICTHRLAKQLFTVDFKNMQYNLSYLRYRFDLPIDDSTGVHRAADDTLVCAKLFEFLVDTALERGLVTNTSDIGEQIHRLCWQSFPVLSWPFGKHKGKKFKEIPTDYYMWAIENMDCFKDKHENYNPDLAEAVRIELETRL